MHPDQAVYTLPTTQRVAAFLDSVNAAATESGANTPILDAVQSNGVEIPESLAQIFDRVPNENGAHAKILDSVRTGMRLYEREHGVPPTADVAEAAMQQAQSAVQPLGQIMPGQRFDSASSLHHDQLSLQPNRAVVAILSCFSEAIPFAGYLPVDIGSNEARVAIVRHLAGNRFGGYAVDDTLDGVASGLPYMAASRLIRLSTNGGGFTAALTATARQGMSLSDPLAVDGATSVLQLLRGRSIVYVNGQPVAFEVSATGSGASAVSGTVTIASTTYSIGGTVNPTTGAISITSSADLPSGTRVLIEVFADYEADPTVAPQVNTKADVYKLYATPWRGFTTTTVDATGQLRNELGIDDQAEGMIALRAQVGAERHYDALRKSLELGLSNAVTYDYDWASQKQQKLRFQVWQDFASFLASQSQKMAEDTADSGITHIYVRKDVATQFLSMPAEFFTPSGILERPGIFRLGTLYGKYAVYYVPRLLTESGGASQMLCVGRSNQVGRNMILLGDAVAPTIIPINVTRTLKYENAYYARAFTSVNPHAQSALRATVINLTNLY